MVTGPRNKGWRDLSARQRAPLVLRGVLQVALSAVALVDIRRRPAEQIKGGKWLWRVAALANFMGIGPIAYWAFGRRSRKESR